MKSRVVETDWSSLEFSSIMMKSINAKFRGVEYNIGKATKDALIKRDIINSENELTRKGEIIAIVNLPLQKQLDFIGIPLRKIHSKNKIKNPELYCLESVQKKSVTAYFSENLFGLHVPYFFLFNELEEWCRKNDQPIFSISCVEYEVNTVSTYLLSKVDEVVNNLDVKNVKAIYERIKIYNAKNNYFYDNTVDLDFYLNILKSIDTENLTRLFTMVLKHPRTLEIGWPDLVVLDNRRLYFVEVKTTDKLHVSQIITFTEVLEQTNIEIQCWQLVKS